MRRCISIPQYTVDKSNMSTFNFCWSIFGERQWVRGDHQHSQFTEHQSKNSHDQAFFLSLVQEVGWTVRSNRMI